MDSLVFDRPVKRSSDLLRRTLLDMLERGSPDDRLIAVSLISDHRVSLHCERIYRQCFSDARNSRASNPAIEALRSYRNLCGSDPDGTFLHAGNAANILPPTASLGLDLVNVWDVTKFLTYCSKDLSGFSPGFMAHWHALGLALRQLSSAEVNVRLKLASRNDSDIVVNRLIPLQAHWAADRPFHPLWSAAAKAYQNWVINDDPMSWLYPLGISVNPLDEVYCVVLKYPATRCGPLVRPTQLEAGAFVFHHPSPPSRPVTLGGVAVPLRPGALGNIGEFIHKQFPFQPADWYRPLAGFVPGRDPKIDSGNARVLHLNALAATTKSNDKKWCKRLKTLYDIALLR